MLRNLMKFEVVETPKLRVAFSQRIGGFTKVVAQMMIARLNQASIFCFKITRLMLSPGKTGVFGKRSLRRETVDVADFGNNTGCIDKTDTFNRS